MIVGSSTARSRGRSCPRDRSDRARRAPDPGAVGHPAHGRGFGSRNAAEIVARTMAAAPVGARHPRDGGHLVAPARKWVTTALGIGICRSRTRAHWRREGDTRAIPDVLCELRLRWSGITAGSRLSARHRSPADGQTPPAALGLEPGPWRLQRRPADLGRDGRTCSR